MVARLAFPDATRRVGIDRCAFAARAEGRATVVREADRGEPTMRFIVRHAKDRRQGERPGLRAEEEVLCHAHNMRKRSRIVNMQMRLRIEEQCVSNNIAETQSKTNCTE